MNDDTPIIDESLCETVGEAAAPAAPEAPEAPEAPAAPAAPEAPPIHSSNSTALATRNMVRCPFFEKPVDEKCSSLDSRSIKRTQRHRSTAQSRLGDMTVGDIRYCFQQLRNAGKDLNPDMVLYNGQSAGEFALKYLRETSTAMRKRRKKLSMVLVDSADDDGAEEEKKPDGAGEEKNTFVANDRVHRRHPSSLNILEF